LIFFAAFAIKDFDRKAGKDRKKNNLPNVNLHPCSFPLDNLSW
jgi:hypothetical protein